MWFTEENYHENKIHPNKQFDILLTHLPSLATQPMLSTSPNQNQAAISFINRRVPRRNCLGGDGS